MTEADFWARLEYRVCGELAGMAETTLRALWCDGFLPDEYLLEQPSPRITGHVWMGRGARRQDQWEFVVVLHAPVGSRDDVPWESLLPPEEVTGWLAVDLEARRIRITPPRAA